MTVQVGDYILDAAAQRWIDVGGEGPLEPGIQGLVWQVTANVDTDTGEIDDVLHVATRRHGRIGFVGVAASDVATAYPCSRQDARGYVSVCRRELAYAGRKQPDSRVIDVMALANQIAAAPERVVDVGESILERADRERAADPDLMAAYQRMQDQINERRRLAGRPPIGDTAA